MTKSLAARDDFVLFLFTLMTNKKTFLQTATLIEDILGVKKVRLLPLHATTMPQCGGGVLGVIRGAGNIAFSLMVQF